jgi:protease II
LDEKAMERDERIARVLIRISDWWERQKAKVSKFIYIDMLRYEKPQLVVKRVQEEVQSWNSKFAGRCEACNHNELKAHFWLDDHNRGFKCFECSRCHHKQPRDNSKMVWHELEKNRIVVTQNGAEPRYMILTIKEQLWVCAAAIIGLLAFDFFFVGNITKHR